MFVADVGYGGLTLAGAFNAQRWPDVGYLSSSLLIALAGYLQAHPARTRATPESAGLAAGSTLCHTRVWRPVMGP